MVTQFHNLGKRQSARFLCSFPYLGVCNVHSYKVGEGERGGIGSQEKGGYATKKGEGSK